MGGVYVPVNAPKQYALWVFVLKALKVPASYLYTVLSLLNIVLASSPVTAEPFSPALNKVGAVLRASSPFAKKKSLFLMMGPPILKPYCLSLKSIVLFFVTGSFPTVFSFLIK